MKKALTLILTVLLFSFSFGQTPKELFIKRDYQKLIKLENNADQLMPEELYMVGFAFFQLENDTKAIEFYDKAISKGLDNGSVYFYKGLSLCYLQKYDSAMKEIEIALEKEPTNQEFLNQKGLIYKYKGEDEQALQIFEEATKVPNTFGEPFFWVAYMVHEKQDFKKALELYYVALDSVPKSNSYYLTTLQNIGLLEYSYSKDYLKSARAYSQAIQIEKDNYELYQKLIKSYNAAKEYTKADSLFKILKNAFEKGKLPKEEMESKAIAIAQFEWNGQVAIIIKSFIDPKEMLDISFKVLVLNKEGDKVERRFLVEKTIQFEKNGAKNLLCEQVIGKGVHITYPYGWSTDNIPLDDLEKAVILVLDGKMNPGASSSFGDQ